MCPRTLLGATFCLFFPLVAFAATLPPEDGQPVEIQRTIVDSHPLSDNPYAARRRAFVLQKQQSAEPPPPEPLPLQTAKKADKPAIPERRAAGAAPLKITIPNIKAAHATASSKPVLLSSFYSGSGTNMTTAARVLPPPQRKTFAMNVGKMTPAIAASLSSSAAIAAPSLEQIVSRDEDSPAKPVRLASAHVVTESPKAAELPREKSPREFAQLAPAAGPDDETPLIAMPETPPPAAPRPLPAIPAGDVKKPAGAPAGAPVPLLDVGPPPAIQEQPSQEIIAEPVTTGRQEKPKPPARAGYNELALDAMVDQILGPDASDEKMSKPGDVLSPANVDTKRVAATSVTHKNEAMSPIASTSEPLMSLSPASRKIAQKLPSNLDKKKKQAIERVEIDRTKDYPVSVNGEDVTVKDEIPGRTLEIKNHTRRVNLDYELENAYNALLSGETMAAIEIYKRVLASDPGNKNALFGLATTYHRAGQIDLARPLYAKLLAIDPKNRDALNNFLVLMADEAPEQALTQLRELETRNPDFSPIPAQMAVIYQKLGDSDKASEKMFRAIALAPENLIYRYNLAIMLDKQNKREEAAQLYKQLVEASNRGETLPVNIQKIQERLTFISSNGR